MVMNSFEFLRRISTQTPSHSKEQIRAHLLDHNLRPSPSIAPSYFVGVEEYNAPFPGRVLLT